MLHAEISGQHKTHGADGAFAYGEAVRPATYRLEVPRTIFLTLRFADPRAYSRAFSGFSVFRVFRAPRRAFFRSSLLKVFVLAINSFRSC